jgi:type IV secretion system protein VirB10
MSLRQRLGLGGPDDETRRETLPPSLEVHGRGGAEEAPEHPSQGSGAEEEVSFIAGERGASTFSGVRSLQSRVTNTLAVALISTLGAGLLGWYYVRTAARPQAARHVAQAAAQSKAEGDLRLPPLGRVDPPTAPIVQVLGPAPAPPPANADSQPAPNPTQISADGGAAAQPPSKPPWQLALERRLGGPVSVTNNGQASASPGENAFSSSLPTGVASAAGVGAEGLSAAARSSAGGASGDTTLGSRLRPSVTPAAAAQILPTQRLLLPKGAFIDCTLETAINSALPGLTTCITATDTFGADGQVVLLERGTKLVGETVGTVQQGAARVFVLWTEARTPTGVVIPLASPGTDELGRAGLTGKVNRHFFERFGAAILVSMIDGAVQAAVGSQSSTGTVVYNPSASQDIMTELLKSTIEIPPTVDVRNGARIQVLVARDLDFRLVYELRAATVSR